MFLNKTLDLLTTIGSPFAEGRAVPQDERKKLEVYRHATKNKIGLLYLERLCDLGTLGCLKEEYDKERDRNRLSKGTLVNLFLNLKELGVPCAAFKSIMLFSCNLNDIDLLIMEEDLKKEKLVRQLTKLGYKDYSYSPASISIHDSRDGIHLVQDKKDPYDIDVYGEISINRFKYLEKRRLRNQLMKIRLDNQDVWTFSPAADLAIQIMHSVVDWELFTLMHYYSILYFLSSASRNQICSFLKIVKENRIIIATRKAVLLSAFIHLLAHNEVPDRLKTLLADLRIDIDKEPAPFKNLETPVKYDLLFLARVLAEKSSDTSAISSMISQFAGMLQPKTARYVSLHLLNRRKAMTY